MIGIVTALHPEAKPIIEKFKLKKLLSYQGPALFRNEHLTLIESGVGALKSAIATTRLLEHGAGSIKFLLNIGICGSCKNHNIGDLLLIHKISHPASGAVFYPDMLLKTQIPEADLSTVDVPLTRPHEKFDLVDMEAAGFFMAAQSYLGPSKIACLKIVSDSCDGAALDAPQVTSLVANRLSEIEAFCALLEEGS